MHAFPPPQGLYDGLHEHDACGVAFVADPDRRRPATTSSPRRSPRCATSTTAAPPAPSRTPATAPGILLQVPDAFLRAVVDFELPAPARVRRRHRVPARRRRRGRARPAAAIEEIAAEEGLTVLGWRDVPVDPSIARRHRARR